MAKTAILTDSACDLTPEQAQRHQIHILNFTITLSDKLYTEREDFTPQEYYQLLRTADSIPVTAHITPFRFQEEYEKFLADGVEELLVVTINSGASATNSAAHMAAKLFGEEHPGHGMEIKIVDSRTYSQAYGWQLCRVAEMLNGGASVAEAARYLEEAFAKTEIVLAPYTLRYIKQSGRISAAAAFAGELLGLKPVITLIDGESVVQQKVRGDRQVVPALAAYFKEHQLGNGPYLVGTTDMENAKALAALCEEAVGYAPEDVFYLGCAVTTNTGPDAIAIVYQGRARR